MRKPVVMPESGAAVAVVSVWFVEPGERVDASERLVEILIGGATIDVAAPATGRLVEKLVWPDDPVIAGQVLGYIEEEA
jgi:pyruvate/2-oxoglutarate dehydrogenase complex dihydrolipoamide acyltransferase (E2) component